MFSGAKTGHLLVFGVTSFFWSTPCIRVGNPREPKSIQMDTSRSVIIVLVEQSYTLGLRIVHKGEVKIMARAFGSARRDATPYLKNQLQNDSCDTPVSKNKTQENQSVACGAGVWGVERGVCTCPHILILQTFLSYQGTSSCS